MDEFRVVIHRYALQDLEDAYLNAARHAPGPAAAWLDRFQQALQTLGTNPERCALAHENVRSKHELREFLFGRRPNVFRVVFTIDERTVRILRIRRSARRFLTRREIDDAYDMGV